MHLNIPRNYLIFIWQTCYFLMGKKRGGGTDNCHILISIFFVIVYLMFSFHRSDCKGWAPFFHVTINSTHEDATGILAARARVVY